MEIGETISSNEFSKGRKYESVLMIPGLLHSKPTDDPCIGKAWPKKSPSGRIYYKMKFDCFVTASGKSLYAKGWSRKSEPNSFDVYAEKPVAARYPLLLDEEGCVRYIAKPAGDGSLDLMLDHRFVQSD